MCNGSEKLAAWMDGELADNEAAAVERHVGDCAECQGRLKAYGDISRLIVTYCEATAGAKPSRKLPRWVPALTGAVAVAAVLLFMLRTAAIPPAPIVARAADPPALIVPTPSAPVKVKAKAVHRRQEGTTRRHPNTDWALADPGFQIVIPAEAMFAPGAVPEGTIFRADLSMASDGSVEGLRLLQ